MNNISRISFMAETAGSPAYLSSSTKVDAPLVERPTPRETAGSPAYSGLGIFKNARLNCDTVSFKGETCGSAAYSVCPDDNCSDEPPKNKNVNFKGRDLSGQKNKSSSPLKTALAVGGIAVSAILGMGYAYKAGAVGRLSDGTIKNMVEPVTKKCYDWCHYVKTGALDLKKKWF